ncbi:MAG: hypothetical protein ACPMAQ_10260 [Phycisphaerae bacterium]
MSTDPREVTSVRIEKPLRCGNCGYSLYTLPMVGRCPECGNRYNAAGRRLHGIFQPQYDVFTAVFSGTIAAVLLGMLAMQRPFSAALAICAGPFVVMTAIAGPIAWRNVCRYLRFRSIQREADRAKG